MLLIQKPGGGGRGGVLECVSDKPGSKGKSINLQSPQFLWAIWLNILTQAIPDLK